MSRLTSVLPSRLASTRFSSSAIFSNSASRSCCLRDGLVHLLLGGALRACGVSWPCRPASSPAAVSLGVLAAALGAACLRRPCRPAAAATTRGRRSRESPAAASWLARLALGRRGRLPEPGPGRPSARLVGLGDVGGARSAPAPPASSRSATDGMRLPAMSFRIWSISAHFSRWPTPNSGLRIACADQVFAARSTRPVSRRPLARSAAAWFSMLAAGLGPVELVGRPAPAVACWSRASCISRSRTSSDWRCHLLSCSVIQMACCSALST